MQIRVGYFEPTQSGHPMLSLDQGEKDWSLKRNHVKDYSVIIPKEFAEMAACIVAFDPTMTFFHGVIRTTWPHEEERLSNVHVTIEKDYSVAVVVGKPPPKSKTALWQGNMATLNYGRVAAEKLFGQIDQIDQMEGLLKLFILLGYDLLQNHPAITQGVNGVLVGTANGTF